MKFFFFVILAAMTAVPLSAEQVNIRKIKVLGNTYTDSRVILDYAKELSEGASWDMDALSNTLRRIENRLYNSSYFYNVSAMLVPSSKETNAVNVILEVNEGFLFRFGGGNSFGYFGIANSFGQGKEFNAMAGYNAQWVEWKDHHSGLGWLYYEGGIGNRPDGNRQKVGATLSAGLDLPFDLSVGLSSEAYRLFDQNYVPEFDVLWLGGKATLNQRSDFFSSPTGTVLNLTGGAFASHGLPRAGAEFKEYMSTFDGALKFAFRASFQAQADWSGDPYFLLGVGGIDGIRRPPTNQMSGCASALASFEIRWAAVTIPLFDFTSVALEPALFADLGRAWSGLGEVTNLTGFLPGYGVALRIFFGMPILVPIRLELGWGENAAPEFFFAVEGPF